MDARDTAVRFLLIDDRASNGPVWTLCGTLYPILRRPPAPRYPACLLDLLLSLHVVGCRRWHSVVLLWGQSREMITPCWQTRKGATPTFSGSCSRGAVSLKG